MDETVAGEPGMDDSLSVALFDGDEGALSYDQRRTFVALLKYEYISAVKHPLEWRTLAESEQGLKSVRGRINELFMDLDVHHEYGIALKRRAFQDDGTTFPTLLRDAAFNREETILMIFLRGRYRSERASGADEVRVDREDLVSHVDTFRPPHATDLAADARRTEKAIENLLKNRILLGAPDTGRPVISPVIEVLMPVEKLRELAEALKSQAQTAADDEVRPESNSDMGDDE